MSLILGKYKNKRKLGKGAYGQVLLVQDPQGRQYALKLISLKSLQKEPYLMDYLEGEIECMQSLNSPYIMRLIQSDEDEKYKYMLCQYCDGGDLLNLQAKQPGQVFTLERATEILAHVIMGLELLHKEDYLHRDIKSQNILIKNENGKQMFKLADFGFSKKSSDIGGTVLGTENYMSPEIYRSDNYGFEVDMWAFGVLFFFMLNKEFPFKINPHYQIERKETELIKLAKNFSFRKAVQNTKKKIMENCTNQTEDLFKKIFNTNAEDRISFHDIRQHPLFKKYFPVIEQASKILYSKKFQSKIIAKTKLQSKIVKQKKQQKKNKPFNEQQQQIQQSFSYMKKKNKEFPKQKAIIENKCDELSFLYESGIQFINADFLNTAEKMNLGFNITKYYIILMRRFISILNPEGLTKNYVGCNWKDYCKTLEFQNLKSTAREDLSKAEMKFDFVYGECEHLISQIMTINPKFEASFDRDIMEQDFDGAFKQSYRKSTHYTFNTLRQSLKSKTNKSTRLNYALSILVICHVFNHIFSDAKNMEIIFADYLQEKKKKVEQVDYSQLREWMTNSTGQKLNYIAKNIIKIYFST